MAKTLVNLVITEFVAQEVDFSQLFSRQSANVKQTVRHEVVEPAVNAEHYPSNNQFCLIAVLGHSDRVDTPGLSAEQRREQERDASAKRATSASEWVFDQITAALTAAGENPPASVADATNFDIYTVPCGAADLVNVVPTNEAQRKENRRVEFAISTYFP
ncbi:hypothetical protein ABZ612_40590 [Streptomyces avermitilis]|uniref:hypothetical protein n=1 Tax=Streptomyces avermitilis TaxID=33903 RepID=UPI0033CEC984